MEQSFHCPFCHGQLYIDEYIVFSAKNENGYQGLIFLTPELGDYRVIKHPDFNITEGEHIDFYCPVCHKNLIVENKGIKFTRIMMIETGEEYEVLFSQLAGEKCTFILGEGIVKSYGKDASNYTNFWGAEPSY